MHEELMPAGLRSGEAVCLSCRFQMACSIWLREWRLTFGGLICLAISARVFRVLKPGGTLVLIAEVYGGSRAKTGQLAEKYASRTGMKLLSVEEHRELLEEVGFSDVRIVEERGKGWICAVGRKTPDTERPRP